MARIEQRFDIADALSALSPSDIAGLDVVLVPYELVTSRDKVSRPQPTETRLKGSGLVVCWEASGLAIETMPHQHK